MLCVKSNFKSPIFFFWYPNCEWTPMLKLITTKEIKRATMIMGNWNSPLHKGPGMHLPFQHHHKSCNKVTHHHKRNTKQYWFPSLTSSLMDLLYSMHISKKTYQNFHPNCNKTRRTYNMVTFQNHIDYYDPRHHS
jgi:hypothetical protein